MKRLVIDTSSTAASAALFEDEQIMGEVFINSAHTHSQKLMPIIDVLMKQTGTRIRDIDAYYVCEGPGSFTGVRIGIATVKGFAQPYKKPVYGFSSMYLIACGLKHHKGLIVPIIDAKREDVYYGVYEWCSEEFGKLEILEEGVESLSSLLVYLQDKYPSREILLVGDAIENYAEIVQSIIEPIETASGTQPFVLGSPMDALPKASNLMIKANESLTDTDVYTIRAKYMRKSQAERDH